MTKELEKKVERAIRLIQSASKVAKEHGQPLEVAYSGGKDSDVILELVRMANVEYRAIYKNTTIDPPGTIRHALENGCEIIQPKHTFYDLIKKRGFPSRFVRFCCSELKEYKVLDYAILGIRKDESPKRAKLYKEPELCRVYSKKSKVRQYFPILDWTKDDVTEFIRERGIKCHKLYYDDDGKFHVERRLGCMCCPIASRKHRINEFKLHPQMVKFYCKGGQYHIDNQHDNGINKFKDVYELFVMNVFCDGIKDFNERFKRKGMLFDDAIDCKKFIEDYFNIKFND